MREAVKTLRMGIKKWYTIGTIIPQIVYYTNWGLSIAQSEQEIYKMEEQTVMQNKSDTPKKKVKHKGLIIFGYILGGLVILILILYFVVTCNTQIIVGFIQKATYGDDPFNSYEPYYEPIDGKKDNGQYLISEIKYDTDIPTATLTSLILTKTGSLTVPRCSISTAAYVRLKP